MAKIVKIGDSEQASEIAGKVAFDKPQTLSPSEQDQAQVNLGLDQVDNTSDADKPVSTAMQTSLDGKIDKSGGVFTGAINGLITTNPTSTTILPKGQNDDLYVTKDASATVSPIKHKVGLFKATAVAAGGEVEVEIPVEQQGGYAGYTVKVFAGTFGNYNTGERVVEYLISGHVDGGNTPHISEIVNEGVATAVFTTEVKESSGNSSRHNPYVKLTNNHPTQSQTLYLKYEILTNG